LTQSSVNQSEFEAQLEDNVHEQAGTRATTDELIKLNWPARTKLREPNGACGNYNTEGLVLVVAARGAGRSRRTAGAWAVTDPKLKLGQS